MLWLPNSRDRTTVLRLFHALGVFHLLDCFLSFNHFSWRRPKNISRMILHQYNIYARAARGLFEHVVLQIDDELNLSPVFRY